MSGAGPQLAVLDVFLVLLRRARSQVLCGLRASQLYAGGYWNLPSGKVDDGEDAISAVLREAREEAGIRLDHRDVEPAGAVHYRPPGRQPRVGFVFLANHDEGRHGAPFNAEPDKCDDLGWHPLTGLPQPFEPYNRTALSLALEGARLAVLGWDQAPVRSRR